jgi:fucose permease
MEKVDQQEQKRQNKKIKRSRLELFVYAAAKVAIESFLKNLWYLTEQVVVLSIFDRQLDPV